MENAEFRSVEIQYLQIVTIHFIRVDPAVGSSADGPFGGLFFLLRAIESHPIVVMRLAAIEIRMLQLLHGTMIDVFFHCVLPCELFPFYPLIYYLRSIVK